MKKIRRSHERGKTDIEWLKSYHSFSFGNYYDPDNMQFRTLRVINDDIIESARGFGKHPHRDMEIVTYMISGALQHEDSLGSKSILGPGEIQRMTAGKGILHSEWNASETEPAHLLQIWILPETARLAPSYEQKLVERTGALTPLVTPDARDGTLKIHQDATISLLAPSDGEAVEIPITAGKGLWVQVFKGSFTSGSDTIGEGDALIVEDLNSLSLSGTGGAQALLFEV